MKVGQVWTYKYDEAIELTIIKYLKKDTWRVLYTNTYGDNGSPFDNLKGSEIFMHFYLSKD